jgi:hypothetical protein
VWVIPTYVFGGWDEIGAGKPRDLPGYGRALLRTGEPGHPEKTKFLRIKHRQHPRNLRMKSC